MMMKNNIYEFDPVIYPRRLWVAVGTDTFKDVFENVSDWDDTAYAIVDNVHDKQRNLGGILIRFANHKAITAENITHEASHAAMEIFNFIDAKINLDNQEPFSYLCGWIAKCINEVKTGKIKD